MTKAELTHNLASALAVLAILAQVALVLLVLLVLLSLLSAAARQILNDLRDALSNRGVWLAWGVALVATLGSLYFSEIAHYIPCRLCWMQRIAMYPLAVILLVGALRRSGREAFAYAFFLPIAGSLVSLYHIYIERFPNAESQSCRLTVPCSTKWINEFGYITIPTLALTAFISIFAILLLSRPRTIGAADE